MSSAPSPNNSPESRSRATAPINAATQSKAVHTHSNPSSEAASIHLIDNPSEWQRFSVCLSEVASASVSNPSHTANPNQDPDFNSNATSLLGNAPTPNAQNTPSTPKIWESQLAFEGMYCGGCAVLLEQTLAALAGVQQVQVNASSQRGKIVWQEGVSRPSDWFLAVEKMGYRALPARDFHLRKNQNQLSRNMLWRLGVAGFCMMQVMMYASPEYTSLFADISPDARQLLRWASWLISLPVLFFSCHPFFSTAWRALRRGQVVMDLPVSLGMLITFGVSMWGSFLAQGSAGHTVYFDSFTMFVFFLLAGRWLELRLREHSSAALSSLMNRMPDSVEVREPDGSYVVQSSQKLAIGDQIRILAGQSIPCDAIVLEGEAEVDESFLNGESTPVLKQAQSTVMAGSINTSGTLILAVQRLGNDTQFAKMLAMMEQAASDKPALVALLDRMARPFLLAELLLALTVGAYWWWQGNPEQAWMAMATVLIVTCPCALSLAAPSAFLAAASALAKQGVLIKKSAAIEALAEADTFFFDKTGTLTEPGLRLVQVHTAQDSAAEASAMTRLAQSLAANSAHPIALALHHADLTSAPLAAPESAPKKQTEQTEQTEQTKQTEQSELHKTHASPPPPGPWSRITEHPGLGLCAQQANGQHYRLGAASWMTEPSPGSAEAKTWVYQGPPPPWSSSIPSANTVSHLYCDGAWLASFRFSESLGAQTQRCIDVLGKNNCHILSGDTTQAVADIAGQIGLPTQQAHGALRPQDKLAILAQAQSKGQRVAMVGDGINDGPVLAQAHVSLAFGKALPLTQAQADFFIMGNRLFLVAASHQHARRTMRVIRQNLLWAAAYNVCMVPLAALGWINAWQAGLGMALSSLLVVANGLRLTRIQVQ